MGTRRRRLGVSVASKPTFAAATNFKMVEKIVDYYLLCEFRVTKYLYLDCACYYTACRVSLGVYILAKGASSSRGRLVGESPS